MQTNHHLRQTFTVAAAAAASSTTMCNHRIASKKDHIDSITVECTAMHDSQLTFKNKNKLCIMHYNDCSVPLAL
jgi:hypothetical protein